MKRNVLTRALFPSALLFASGAFAAPPPEHPMAREPENEQSTSTLGQLAPRDEATSSSATDPTADTASTSSQAARSDTSSTSNPSTAQSSNSADQAALHSSSTAANPERPKSATSNATTGDVSAASPTSDTSSTAQSSGTTGTAADTASLGASAGSTTTGSATIGSSERKLEADDRAASLSNERSADSSSSNRSDTVNDSSSISSTQQSAGKDASERDETSRGEMSIDNSGIAAGSAGTTSGMSAEDRALDNDRAATTTTQDTVSTEAVTSMHGAQSDQPSVAASAAESTNISMSAIKANFDAFDKSGKGYITREDAVADPHLSAQFDTLDADHDGKLSVTEYMAARNVAQFRPQQGVDQGVQRE